MAIYASFVTASMHVTDCVTAELVKVVENKFRDVNIAFANELALLCEELGVDVWETLRLANEHPRVSILSPGPGVGGHCIPVDPHFLSNANPFVTELIQTARRINERMPDLMVRRVTSHVALPARDATITLLGAAYKPNVADARESRRTYRLTAARTRLHDQDLRSSGSSVFMSLVLDARRGHYRERCTSPDHRTRRVSLDRSLRRRGVHAPGEKTYRRTRAYRDVGRPNHRVRRANAGRARCVALVLDRARPKSHRLDNEGDDFWSAFGRFSYRPKFSSLC